MINQKQNNISIYDDYCNYKMKTTIINQEKIKEAIIEIIVFFDVFSFPLTSFEIWQYLPYKCTLKEVNDILLEKIEYIDSDGVFYYLRGKHENIQERNRRYNHSNRKIKRARRIAKLFSFLPWIKLIAVANLIGADNLKDSSDIDLFIV